MDSSYAVHPDMHSHSGIFMSLRKGATNSTSCKQKPNTKSSTETELVAIDDAMGQGVMDGSLTTQGLVIPEATIRYQDNKSTILLAEDGEVSSSRRT